MKVWNHDGETISLNENKSFMLFEEGPYGAGANVAMGNFFEPPDSLPWSAATPR